MVRFRLPRSLNNRGVLYSVSIEMLRTIALALVVVAAAAALRLMWALRRGLRSADATGAIDNT
jgi:hypothetical protein